MAVKEWFRRLQPVQLYLVLFFTVAFFAVEIIASYVTHALTLLMNAYHMLCNIIALVGCIASIKCQNNTISKSNENSMNSLKISTNSLDEKSLELTSKKSKQTRSEKRMKNTFGWARIDVVTMLVCCVLLASFCFSLIIEALQTLVHISHSDEMHHSLAVMSIGASGVLLNAFCYFLIGGYTFNQGVLLHFTKNGSIILKRTISAQSSKINDNELTKRSPIELPKGQGARELCRDVLGCILVMITSIIVYFTEKDIAKYIDPSFAIISAVSLFWMSYPYMKESGMILLQTIPNHINIDSLQKDLLAAFPDILNVHDLHVWQLNSEKIYSTVHIIYADPSVCARITDQITSFFIEMGITHVTIQPEFCITKLDGNPFNDCLIRCQSKNCSGSTCCSRNELDEVIHDHDHHHHHHHHHHHDHGHQHIVNKKFGSKEILPSCSSIDLKRFSANVDESSEISTITTASKENNVTVEKEKEKDDEKEEKVVEKCINDVIKASNDVNSCCRTVDVDIVKSTITNTITTTSANSEELSITECNDDDHDLRDDKATISDS